MEGCEIFKKACEEFKINFVSKIFYNSISNE